MRSRGFTLLELSIVLVIISLVTGMAVSSGISVIATARQTATQQKMKVLDDALMQYRTANDRLPCPGDLTLASGSADYGLEAGADASSAIGTGTGACTGTGMLPQANFTGTGINNTFSTGAEGAVPAVTLDLSPDLMVDGWGNKLRYAVDTNMTLQGAFSSMGISCAIAAVTINDSNSAARSTGSVYALISSGANGHGAYTSSGTVVNAGSTNTNEQTNCHCNSSAVATTYSPTYVQAQQTLDPTNPLDNFDDLVSYKERWQLQTPWDKTGGCGYVYVTDSGNNRVQIFNLNGSFVSTFGASGSGNGQFSNPQAIAVDNSGNIWVGDSNNHRVQEFNSSGSYLNQLPIGYSDWWLTFDKTGNLWMYNNAEQINEWSITGASLQTFSLGYYPSSVILDSGSNVWIGNPNNGAYAKYTNTGTLVTNFAPTGASTLNEPEGMAFDTSGNIWVVSSYAASSSGSNSVFKFSSSGTYLAVAGCGGVPGGCNNSTVAGYFNNPIAVALDPNGNVWVTDSGNNRVQGFNSSGSYIGQFGSSGSSNGQFSSPYGIAISSR